MARKKNQIVIATKSDAGSNNEGMGKWLFYAAMAIGGAFGLNYLVQQASKNNASGSIQNDKNAQQATTLFNILSTNGALNWYYRVYYPGLLEIINVAKQITDWQAVQARYNDLYRDDITTLLNQHLKPEDYQAFLRALSMNGSPGNRTGSGKIETVNPSGLIPNQSHVFLDSTKGNVNLYKNINDYPGTPYLSFPKGTVMGANGNIFVQTAKFTYVGTAISVYLYQIKMLNGTLVWVNYANIRKVTK